VQRPQRLALERQHGLAQVLEPQGLGEPQALEGPQGRLPLALSSLA
jgi:hypothetical protein